MSFSAFIGFQGWNSWTPEVSGLSVTSRSATASLLPGWVLASSLGGLISILVSRLELSSASRLRAAALSEAVLSEAVLSDESCASETVVSSANKTIGNRIRTPLLYRDPSGETGALARPHKSPQKNQAAHRRGSLVWQSPPGRRGKLDLQGWRSCARRPSLVAGRLRWGRSGPSIGHQANIHAAILGATAGSFIGLDRLILTQPDLINLVGRNALLRSQVLNHSIGTALAQIVVVLWTAHRVGRAFNRDDVSLGSRNAGRQLVDRFPGVLRQIVPVESEMHRRLHYRTIVVEVDDSVGQSVDTLGGAIRRQLRLIGIASRGHSLLVHLCGLCLDSLDSSLGALIDVLNVFRILRGQIVEFVSFIDQRCSLLTHVILGCTSEGCDQCRRQHQGQFQRGAIHKL